MLQLEAGDHFTLDPLMVFVHRYNQNGRFADDESGFDTRGERIPCGIVSYIDEDVPYFFQRRVDGNFIGMDDGGHTRAVLDSLLLHLAGQLKRDGVPCQMTNIICLR